MSETKREKSDSNQITQADLDRIRELAQKATPGPWKKIDNHNIFTHGGAPLASTDPCRWKSNTLFDSAGMEENAAYIAAANPAFVLVLVDEVERLRKDKARLEKEADWLAEALSDLADCSKIEDCEECALFDENHHFLCLKKKIKGNCGWREAARKAVEEQCQE